MSDHKRLSSLVELFQVSPSLDFERMQLVLALDEAVLNDFLILLENLGILTLRCDKRSWFLQKDIQMLSADSIKVALSDEATRKVHILSPLLTVDSTNQYLKSIKTKLSDKIRVCVTEHQSDGRGRQSKRWFASIAKNVIMSLHVRLETPSTDVGGVSLMVGVSIVSALNELGVAGLKIKWPNDVYSDGKKIAGILIESTKLADSFVELVIGIGVNVKVMETEAEHIDQAWTDLESIADQKWCRSTIIATIMNHLVTNLARYEEYGISGFQTDWTGLDYLLSKEIIVISAGKCATTGVAAGINERGELLMRTHNNGIVNVLSGYVSVHRSE